MQSPTWMAWLTALACVVGCGQSVAPTSVETTPATNAPVAAAALQPVPLSSEVVTVPDDGARTAHSAFARLVQAAESNDPALWSSAEQELQQLGDAVVPALIPALRGDNPLRRELAVMFLAQLGPLAAPAADDLAKLLKDPSPVVRVNAAAVLTSLERPVPAAVDALADLLDADDVSIRLTAIASLGNAGPLLARSAVPRLETCLTDNDPRVRSAATLALGQFGASAKEVLPRLRLLSNDDDPAVRDAVTVAVQRIAGEAAVGPE